MNTVELDVQGMTCGSCVKHVTRVLQSVPGVSHVNVDLANGRARVEGDLPSGAQPLIAALASEDYPAQVASGADPLQSPKTAGCHTGTGSKGGCCCN
nr:heavy metal-associated domain-containing protein [uncultured Rhodoferax sp.]